MFQQVAPMPPLGRDELEAALMPMRAALLDAQRRLRESGRSLLVLVSGVELAGKSAVVNRLYEWLDGRGVTTHAFWDETDEERERPPSWRFWRALPARGSTRSPGRPGSGAARRWSCSRAPTPRAREA